MKIRIVSIVTVRTVEERVAKRWLRGAGNAAEFAEDSQGWYATFAEWPGSAYLGNENPGLGVGDKIKITLEKVS